MSEVICKASGRKDTTRAQGWIPPQSVMTEVQGHTTQSRDPPSLFPLASHQSLAGSKARMRIRPPGETVVKPLLAAQV